MLVPGGYYKLQTTRIQDPGSRIQVYRGYKTTRLQAARIQRLQDYMLQDIASQPCAHKGPADNLVFCVVMELVPLSKSS